MNIQRISLPERETLPTLLMESFKHAYLRADYAVATRLLSTLQHLLLSPGRVTPDNAEAVAAMLEEVDRLQSAHATPQAALAGQGAEA